MTVLHDSHAIGAEHPPVLATLLDATRAVLTLLRNPAAGGQEAMDAIAAYVQAAGLEPNGVTERLITTVERTARNPHYQDNDELLIAAAAFFAQRPDDQERVRYVSASGVVLRAVKYGKTGARGQGALRLQARGARRISFSVRQALRTYGPLLRTDLQARKGGAA